MSTNFIRSLALLILLIVGASHVYAQLAANTTGNEFATQQAASGAAGKSVVGAVQMCLNASGVAVPADAAGANCGGALAGGNVNGSFPANSTPIAGNSTGTTGAVTGTLAGAAAKTTYICDFDVSVVGGTAQFSVTVAGLKGGSRVYQMSATTAGATLSKTFTPCFPASAVNTPITIATSGQAAATATDVNSGGYQQ